MTNDQTLAALMFVFAIGYILGWATRTILVKRKVKKLAQNPPF